MSTDRISEYLAQFSQTRSQMIEPAPPRHRRPDRGHRADPRRHLHARPLPARRRARPGQDAHGQLHQPDPRRVVQAHPVHARPDAVGHHRHHDPRRSRSRPPRVPLRQGPDLRQHHPRRRNQPHAAQDAGRPARSHAGTPGHRPARTPTTCPSRSSSSPRRTRSSRKAPIRCPRPSSTASCSTSRSIIPRSTRRRTHPRHDRQGRSRGDDQGAERPRRS